MLGYHANPSANAECFAADGWFDSGDLGFIHQGRLALTGRAKEMIIIRGVRGSGLSTSPQSPLAPPPRPHRLSPPQANFYCYEIEEIVAGVEGTVPARVAATSVYDEAQATEALLVFFVPRADAVAEDDVKAMHDLSQPATDTACKLCATITQAIVTQLGLAPRHVIPVTDEGFHRTTSGKIQRGAFKGEYTSGVFDNAVRAIERANSNASEATYQIVWRGREASSGFEGSSAYEYAEEPIYIITPKSTGSSGAAFAQAATSRAFRVTLPTSLEVRACVP